MLLGEYALQGISFSFLFQHPPKKAKEVAVHIMTDFAEFKALNHVVPRSEEHALEIATTINLFIGSHPELQRQIDAFYLRWNTREVATFLNRLSDLEAIK